MRTHETGRCYDPRELYIITASLDWFHAPLGYIDYLEVPVIEKDIIDRIAAANFDAVDVYGHGTPSIY